MRTAGGFLMKNTGIAYDGSFFVDDLYTEALVEIYSVSTLRAA